MQVDETSARWLQGSANNSTSGQPNDAQIIRDTFVVYGAIFAVVTFLFCIVRLRFPKAYTIRQWVEDHKVCALYSCLFFVAFILFWVLASHRRCVILLLFRENRRHWPTISSASSLGCGSYFICPTTNCA